MKIAMCEHPYTNNVKTCNIASLSQVKNVTIWQWFHLGTQGDQWKNAQIYINRDDGKMLSITFVGTRGVGYAGDIALDDISFATGDMCQYSKSYLLMFSNAILVNLHISRKGSKSPTPYNILTNYFK